jgi:hypothetical protein
MEEEAQQEEQEKPSIVKALLGFLLLFSLVVNL